MDRSIGRLPDPSVGTPNGERRRCVRQKLHTPVYASFNGPQAGMVVDLSELLDLHEEGFSVQTSERLETNRAVSLCLDLPETRSFIHGTGQVVWSDETGRGGIRFSALPANGRQVLKEWLFANLLIACSNHQARSEQLARHEEEKALQPVLVSDAIDAPAVSTAASMSDQGEVIPDVDTGLAPTQTRQASSLQLEAVRSEVREIGDDFDAVLQLVTERALDHTGASGAALAFLTDDKMICRARTGEPAPPLGAVVDIQQGLSGECVRGGLLVSCEDTENDPRVDPEVSRALGIGSLMASPIVSDFRVVGLLEVFSPQPRSFTKDQGTMLDRLVEMIPTSLGVKVQRESAPAELETAAEGAQILDSEVPSPMVSAMELDSLEDPAEALREDEPEVERVAEQVAHPFETKELRELVPEVVPELAPAGRSRLLYRALIGLAIAVVFIVVGYLLGPIVVQRFSSQGSRASFVRGAEAAAPVSGQSLRDHNGAPRTLAELQALADRGDADAQWQMAVRNHDGDGVPQSDTQAMLWFQLAAEQGNVAAQSAMGSYYWAGRGVPEDLSKAYMWSEIALAGGDKNSKARLEGLASRMTRAQISAARQQAEVWIRSHSQGVKSEAN